MSGLEAFLLGLVQGVTEFLPISSTGHLLLASHWFEIPASQNLFFILSLHLATCLSILLVFYKDIFFLAKELLHCKWYQGQWNQGTQFFLKILIAAIPIALVGLFFEEKIALFFGESTFVVASMLFVTGLLLLLSHLKITSKKTKILLKNTPLKKEIGYLASFWIGLAQCIAILPGLSRSGATIAIGLLLGYEKKEVTRFSFLILLLPVLGASLLSFFHWFLEFFSASPIKNELTQLSISPLTLSISFLTAFISGYFCCRLVRYAVLYNKLIYFALYCFFVSFLLFFFA